MNEDIKEHDIIQISPTNERFGGLVMVVDEVKSWGVQAGLTYPHTWEERRGIYGRFEWREFVKVGTLEWIPQESSDQ